MRGSEDNTDSDLIEAAKSARGQAYVPYSGFAVGAALKTGDGSIITGANIENASYGLTNCAERSAMFTLLTQRGQEGVRVDEIAVVADAPVPVSPCGACRQVLTEFCAPQTPVILANLRGDIKRTTVGELLPGAFTPDQMAYAESKDKASQKG
ncbi:cytidine deaminase [Alicyclobacillus dauci]|uniref:Cytidine deaminase n=1 Tax=Alicyclobacillus dauci TaxID=1475485 RepID=A0ABY6ZAM3_9BACL|nr:cytidine deaminase [Alicyclobacillus dauci]WAH39284.1 cytidine deaminase [Alicyclobacillus dauci]